VSCPLGQSCVLTACADVVMCQCCCLVPLMWASRVFRMVVLFFGVSLNPTLSFGFFCGDVYVTKRRNATKKEERKHRQQEPKEHSKEKTSLTTQTTLSFGFFCGAVVYVLPCCHCAALNHYSVTWQHPFISKHLPVSCCSPHCSASYTETSAFVIPCIISHKCMLLSCCQ
jgi:hypothetical protein